MRVLVACEYSGRVRDAFIRHGHDAMSCDILPAEGPHIQDDVLNHLEGWDRICAFPPCTHICVSGSRWMKEKREDGRQQKGIDFFMALVNAPCDHIAIENPVGIMSTVYRKPDQIIQPWLFGHGETKTTCLWLKNLSLLEPTNVVEGRENRIWKMGPSEERSKLRSLTYQGIADAMGDQWSQPQYVQMELEA